MRYRTAKRAAQEREYRRLRDEYMTVHSLCEFPSCFTDSQELHHRRGRVGSDLTDPSNFMALCSPHHRWATEHPVEAKRLGVSESRLSIREGTCDAKEAAQEAYAEDRADQRAQGDPISDREYDQLEAGRWWNSTPGMHPMGRW